MNKKLLTSLALVFTLMCSGIMSTWAQPPRRAIKLRQKIKVKRQKKRAIKAAKRKVAANKVPFALKAGLRHLRDGRTAAAAKSFATAVKSHPRNLRARLLLAITLSKLNRNRQAYIILKKTLETYPNNAESHFLMGALLFKNRRFQLAKVHLNRSLHLPAKLKSQQQQNAEKMLKLLEGQESQNITTELSDDNSPEITEEERELSTPSVEVSIYHNLENKFRIAVFDFKNKNDSAKSHNHGEIFSEMLTTALIKNKGFDVVERGQIKEVLDEKTLQMSGVVESPAAQEIGNLLGVDFVVIGGISTLTKQIEIDLRLVQVENGEAVLAESATAYGESELRNTATSVVNKIDQIYQQEGK